MTDDVVERKSPDEALVTDVQFELRGTLLPKDHGLLVYQAVECWLPWIKDEPLLGIHPIQGADLGDGNLMLNRRGKLVLRVPRPRIAEAMTLAGRALDVSGHHCVLGAGKLRALSWHTPLYAHCVTTGHADERAFTQDILEELDRYKIDSRFICGRRQTLTTPQGLEAGYSLMLHGLPIEHALLIQEQGLGKNRKLGCGIFIPHKSIVAVS